MKTLFTSRINFSLLKYHATRFKALMFVFFVLLLTTFPVPLMVNYFSTARPETGDFLVQSSLLILVLVSIGLVMITPFVFFNYLFSKRALDVFHALPIRRRDLYITYVLGSLLMVLIPFTLTYIFGYLLAYGLIGVLPTTMHLLTYFRILVILMAINSMTCFVIMNTGTVSDAIIYTVIMNVAPFILYLAIQFFSTNFIPGFGLKSSDVLGVMSPHYAILMVLLSTDLAYPLNIAPSFWFIMTMVVHALSVWLYDNRKSERSEEPFTNSVFFSLITSLFTAALLIGLIAVWSSFSGNTRTLLSPRVLILPLLICFVIYVLLNIIKNRSARRIRNISRNYGIVVLSTLLVCTTLYFTEGFGFTMRIPQAQSVRYVDILSPGTQSIRYLGNTLGNLRLTETEDIQLFIDTHRTIAEHSKTLRNQNDYEVFDDNREISFTYQLTNGTKLSRTFKTTDALLEPLEKLAASESVQDQLNPLYSSRYKPPVALLHNASLTKSYQFAGSFSELARIHKQETSHYTLEDYMQGGKPLKYSLVYGEERGMFQLNIDTRHTESIAYIEEHIGASYKTAYDFKMNTLTPLGGPYPSSITRPFLGNLIKPNMSSFHLEDGKELTPQEALALEGSLYNTNIQKDYVPVLIVNGTISDTYRYFSTIIPIIES